MPFDLKLFGLNLQVLKIVGSHNLAMQLFTV